MPVSNLSFRGVCGQFYWRFQFFMHKRKEAIERARISKIKLYWPLNFVRSVSVFLAVLTVCCVCSDKLCDSSHSFGDASNPLCDYDTANPTSSLRRCFPQHHWIQMLATALRFVKRKHTPLSCRTRVTSKVNKGGPLGTLSICVIVFLSVFLLQCGDIESNPGPGGSVTVRDSNRHEEIGNFPPPSTSSRHFPSSSPHYPPPPPYPPALPRALLPLQIDDMRWMQSMLDHLGGSLNFLADNMKRHLQEVSQTQAALVKQIDALSDCCKTLSSENDQLKADVDWLSGRCDHLERQCKQLCDEQRYCCDTANSLNEEVDKLEAHSKSNNLRFFNVYEDSREDNMTCREKVVKLLNKFYPSKTWSTADIEQAYRIGQKQSNPNRPRVLVARLHTWPDKLSLLEDKERRKEMAEKLGVRISTDLTTRQQTVIQEQKKQGRDAYYRNGRLCFRTPRPRRPDWTQHNGRQENHSVRNTNLRSFQKDMPRGEHCAEKISNEQSSRPAPRSPPSIFNMTEYPSLPEQQSSTSHKEKSQPDRAVHAVDSDKKEGTRTNVESSRNHDLDSSCEILAPHGENNVGTTTVNDTQGPTVDSAVTYVAPPYHHDDISQDLFRSQSHELPSVPAMSDLCCDNPTDELFDAESQTFVKQRFVPEETCDRDSQFLVPHSDEHDNVDNQPGDKVMQSDSFLSIENEVNSQTPAKGPQTRSKIKCRQTQLTESFKSTSRKADIKSNAIT